MVSAVSDVQGVEEAKEKPGSSSHVANVERKRDPSLAQIFNKFSLGGGIENPEKQKFDNLFNAVLDSSTSWLGETATL